MSKIERMGLYPVKKNVHICNSSNNWLSKGPNLCTYGLSGKKVDILNTHDVLWQTSTLKINPYKKNKVLASMGCYAANSDWALLVNGLAESQVNKIDDSRVYAASSSSNGNYFYFTTTMTQKICNAYCGANSFSYAALVAG